MNKAFKKLFLSLILITIFAAPLNIQALETIAQGDSSNNSSACELKIEQRRLWTDHVLWTRNAAISLIYDIEDKDAVVERLLRNQDEIGASIKPYYGEEAGNQLAKLLREHIQIAAQLIEAAKNNNKEDLDKYNKLGLKNSDEIADLLSSANPNYSNKTLRDMLYGHLKLLTDQVVAQLNKDWDGSVKAYDDGQDHMLVLADILADGIVKQFPKKFK